ncbi:MAG: hypothetical protein LBI65_02120 [Candidatus Symbiothrix sp.]|jgi:hypothetical protein|nr:hypothetical protein [Candidatus Symbiothrix sp.]
MEYGEEFLKRMKLFGLLQYSLDRMVVIISEDGEKISIPEFKNDFANPEHPVFIEYDKGYKNADFAIETALFNEAGKGNKDAVKALEDYRGRQYYKLKVREIFDV